MFSGLRLPLGPRKAKGNAVKGGNGSFAAAGYSLHYEEVACGIANDYILFFLDGFNDIAHLRGKRCGLKAPAGSHQ